MARASKTVGSTSDTGRSTKSRMPNAHVTWEFLGEAVTTWTGAAPYAVDQPMTSKKAAASKSSAPWQSNSRIFFGGIVLCRDMCLRCCLTERRPSRPTAEGEAQPLRDRPLWPESHRGPAQGWLDHVDRTVSPVEAVPARAHPARPSPYSIPMISRGRNNARSGQYVVIRMTGMLPKIMNTLAGPIILSKGQLAIRPPR